MNKELIVAKFGGSSVRDHVAMNRSSAIVASDANIKVVVISATYNSTNQLELLAKLSSEGKKEERDREFKVFQRRHILIGEFLKAPEEIYQLLNIIYDEAKIYLEQIEKQFTKELMDSLYGIGERVSSALFAVALGQQLALAKRPEVVELVDIRKFIITDDNFGGANPLIDQMKERFKTFPLEENKIIVTQGFIGSTLEGKNTVLGREGSDFSAALIAEGLNAKTLQIWTDVPGIFSTDPKKTNKAQLISHMTYDEAYELASLGAKVLFKRTLEPAGRKAIPVFVLSSYDAKASGTKITQTIESAKRPLVLGFTLDKGRLGILTSTNNCEAEIYERLKKIGITNLLEKKQNSYVFSYDEISSDDIHDALFSAL